MVGGITSSIEPTRPEPRSLKAEPLTLNRAMNKVRVFDELKAHLGDFSAFGVERIVVFGSVVHDAATPESGIDILVRFLPAQKTFDTFMGLRRVSRICSRADRSTWSLRIPSSRRFEIGCCRRRPMSRDLNLYLDDIAQAIQYVTKFTNDMTFTDFESDVKTQHACVRNLEIIGEAVKKIPEELRAQIPDVPRAKYRRGARARTANWRQPSGITVIASTCPEASAAQLATHIRAILSFDSIVFEAECGVRMQLSSSRRSPPCGT
jgi:uncharacterized protein with HEPN domain/predicted nucleotidyltransferase